MTEKLHQPLPLWFSLPRRAHRQICLRAPVRNNPTAAHGDAKGWKSFEWPFLKWWTAPAPGTSRRFAVTQQFGRFRSHSFVSAFPRIDVNSRGTFCCVEDGIVEGVLRDHL
jgi:hypothetical protein